jgi:hypothetical protein
MAEVLVDLDNRNNVVPPLLAYEGDSSFFGGTPPLPEGVGKYQVVHLKQHDMNASESP